MNPLFWRMDLVSSQTSTLPLSDKGILSQAISTHINQRQNQPDSDRVSQVTTHTHTDVSHDDVIISSPHTTP